MTRPVTGIDVVVSLCVAVLLVSAPCDALSYSAQLYPSPAVGYFNGLHFRVKLTVLDAANNNPKAYFNMSRNQGQLILIPFGARCNGTRETLSATKLTGRKANSKILSVANQFNSRANNTVGVASPFATEVYATLVAPNEPFRICFHVNSSAGHRFGGWVAPTSGDIGVKNVTQPPIWWEERSAFPAFSGSWSFLAIRSRKFVLNYRPYGWGDVLKLVPKGSLCVTDSPGSKYAPFALTMPYKVDATMLSDQKASANSQSNVLSVVEGALNPAWNSNRNFTNRLFAPLQYPSITVATAQYDVCYSARFYRLKWWVGGKGKGSPMWVKLFSDARKLPSIPVVKAPVITHTANDTRENTYGVMKLQGTQAAMSWGRGDMVKSVAASASLGCLSPKFTQSRRLGDDPRVLLKPYTAFATHLNTSYAFVRMPPFWFATQYNWCYYLGVKRSWVVMTSLQTSSTAFQPTVTEPTNYTFSVNDTRAGTYGYIRLRSKINDLSALPVDWRAPEKSPGVQLKIVQGRETDEGCWDDHFGDLFFADLGEAEPKELSISGLGRISDRTRLSEVAAFLTFPPVFREGYRVCAKTSANNWEWISPKFFFSTTAPSYRLIASDRRAGTTAAIAVVSSQPTLNAGMDVLKFVLNGTTCDAYPLQATPALSSNLAIFCSTASQGFPCSRYSSFPAVDIVTKQSRVLATTAILQLPLAGTFTLCYREYRRNWVVWPIFRVIPGPSLSVFPPPILIAGMAVPVAFQRVVTAPPPLLQLDDTAMIILSGSLCYSNPAQTDFRKAAFLLQYPEGIAQNQAMQAFIALPPSTAAEQVYTVCYKYSASANWVTFNNALRVAPSRLDYSVSTKIIAGAAVDVTVTSFDYALNTFNASVGGSEFGLALMTDVCQESSQFAVRVTDLGPTDALGQRSAAASFVVPFTLQQYRVCVKVNGRWLEIAESTTAPYPVQNTFIATASPLSKVTLDASLSVLGAMAIAQGTTTVTAATVPLVTITGTGFPTTAAQTQVTSKSLRFKLIRESSGLCSANAAEYAITSTFYTALKTTEIYPVFNAPLRIGRYVPCYQDVSLSSNWLHFPVTSIISVTPHFNAFTVNAIDNTLLVADLYTDPISGKAAATLHGGATGDKLIISADIEKPCGLSVDSALNVQVVAANLGNDVGGISQTRVNLGSAFATAGVFKICYQKKDAGVTQLKGVWYQLPSSDGNFMYTNLQAATALFTTTPIFNRTYATTINTMMKFEVTLTYNGKRIVGVFANTAFVTSVSNYFVYGTCPISQTAQYGLPSTGSWQPVIDGTLTFYASFPSPCNPCQITVSPAGASGSLSYQVAVVSPRAATILVMPQSTNIQTDTLFQVNMSVVSSLGALVAFNDRGSVTWNYQGAPAATQVVNCQDQFGNALPGLGTTQSPYKPAFTGGAATLFCSIASPIQTTTIEMRTSGSVVAKQVVDVVTPLSLRVVQAAALQVVAVAPVDTATLTWVPQNVTTLPAPSVTATAGHHFVAGKPYTITVRAVDATGGVVTASAATASLQLSVAVFGGSVSVTTVPPSITLTAGYATFTLTADRYCGNYTTTCFVQIQSSQLAPAIVATAIRELGTTLVLLQPNVQSLTAQTDVPLPNITVALQGKSGQQDYWSASTVFVSLSASVADAQVVAVGGTTSTTLKNGTGTFSNVTVRVPGLFRLAFYSPASVDALRSPFVVVAAGTANRVAFLVPPPTSVVLFLPYNLTIGTVSSANRTNKYDDGSIRIDPSPSLRASNGIQIDGTYVALQNGAANVTLVFTKPCSVDCRVMFTYLGSLVYANTVQQPSLNFTVTSVVDTVVATQLIITRTSTNIQPIPSTKFPNWYQALPGLAFDIEVAAVNDLFIVAASGPYASLTAAVSFTGSLGRSDLYGDGNGFQTLPLEGNVTKLAEGRALFSMKFNGPCLQCSLQFSPQWPGGKSVSAFITTQPAATKLIPDPNVKLPATMYPVSTTTFSLFAVDDNGVIDYFTPYVVDVKATGGQVLVSSANVQMQTRSIVEQVDLVRATGTSPAGSTLFVLGGQVPALNSTVLWETSVLNPLGAVVKPYTATIQFQPAKPVVRLVVAPTSSGIGPISLVVNGTGYASLLPQPSLSVVNGSIPQLLVGQYYPLTVQAVDASGVPVPGETGPVYIAINGAQLIKCGTPASLEVPGYPLGSFIPLKHGNTTISFRFTSPCSLCNFTVVYAGTSQLAVQNLQFTVGPLNIVSYSYNTIAVDASKTDVPADVSVDTTLTVGFLSLMTMPGDPTLYFPPSSSTSSVTVGAPATPTTAAVSVAFVSENPSGNDFVGGANGGALVVSSGATNVYALRWTQPCILCRVRVVLLSTGISFFLRNASGGTDFVVTTFASQLFSPSSTTASIVAFTNADLAVPLVAISGTKLKDFRYSGAATISRTSSGGNGDGGLLLSSISDFSYGESAVRLVFTQPCLSCVVIIQAPGLSPISLRYVIKTTPSVVLVRSINATSGHVGDFIRIELAALDADEFVVSDVSGPVTIEFIPTGTASASSEFRFQVQMVNGVASGVLPITAPIRNGVPRFSISSVLNSDPRVSLNFCVLPGKMIATLPGFVPAGLLFTLALAVTDSKAVGISFFFNETLSIVGTTNPIYAANSIQFSGGTANVTLALPIGCSPCPLTFVAANLSLTVPVVQQDISTTTAAQLGFPLLRQPGTFAVASFPFSVVIGKTYSVDVEAQTLLGFKAAVPNVGQVTVDGSPSSCIDRTATTTTISLIDNQATLAVVFVGSCSDLKFSLAAADGRLDYFVGHPIAARSPSAVKFDNASIPSLDVSPASTLIFRINVLDAVGAVVIDDFNSVVVLERNDSSAANFTRFVTSATSTVANGTATVTVQFLKTSLLQPTVLTVHYPIYFRCGLMDNATDRVRYFDVVGPFTITPTAAALILSTIPSSWVVGRPFLLSVSAVDGMGDRVPSPYNGNNARATVSASSTSVVNLNPPQGLTAQLKNGFYQFQLVFSMVGAVNLTVYTVGPRLLPALSTSYVREVLATMTIQIIAALALPNWVSAVGSYVAQGQLTYARLTFLDDKGALVSGDSATTIVIKATNPNVALTPGGVVRALNGVCDFSFAVSAVSNPSSDGTVLSALVFSAAVPTASGGSKTIQVTSPGFYTGVRQSVFVSPPMKFSLRAWPTVDEFNATLFRNLLSAATNGKILPAGITIVSVCVQLTANQAGNCRIVDSTIATNSPPFTPIPQPNSTAQARTTHADRRRNLHRLLLSLGDLVVTFTLSTVVQSQDVFDSIVSQFVATVNAAVAACSGTGSSTCTNPLALTLQLTSGIALVTLAPGNATQTPITVSPPSGPLPEANGAGIVVLNKSSFWLVAACVVVALVH